jgi:hypothetical protein
MKIGNAQSVERRTLRVFAGKSVDTRCPSQAIALSKACIALILPRIANGTKNPSAGIISLAIYHSSIA